MPDFVLNFVHQDPWYIVWEIGEKVRVESGEKNQNCTYSDPNNTAEKRAERQMTFFSLPCSGEFLINA